VTKMDREVAQFVVASAARSAHEIASLMPFLREYASGTENDALRHAIASAVYEIGLVQDMAFKEYPDLKAEYEARLKKFGRPVY
jgi:hypothetical protein